MKKLLVTTDLSVNSKAGIKFAIQFAKQLNARLLFYHVAEIAPTESGDDKLDKRFEKEYSAERKKRLEDFVKKTVSGSSKLPAGCEFTVPVNVDVDTAIINAAKKNKADFICMSTRGAGKVQKIFGTNASEIITASPIPVVVVPKGYRVSKINDLFFACDFAALKKEIKTVLDLASALKARLKVFHYDYLLNVPENAKKLERKVADLKSGKVSFHFRKLEIEHSLSEHLAKDIKKEKPSMVVLFTKQDRNWFDRLTQSSEAAEMSFHTSLPLLTFKKK